MWGADKGSSALSASVTTSWSMRAACSHTTVHGQRFLKQSRTTWSIWPCAFHPVEFLGFLETVKDKTEPLMRSGLWQLRQKKAARWHVCWARCLQPDLSHLASSSFGKLNPEKKFVCNIWDVLCTCRCFESNISNSYLSVSLRLLWMTFCWVANTILKGFV